MIELILPYPPTVNSLYAGKKRRYPSPRYKRWRAQAGWELRQQRPQPATGRVAIDIELTPPDARRRDASNYVKAIEDLIVDNGILADDDSRHIASVTARWSDSPGRPIARVRITPAA